MGASSYWREYHILAAHCGWKVPVGVAKPCRPDEIAQVYLVLPFSTTVRRWAPRSALRTSVIGGGGGRAGTNSMTGGGAAIRSLPIPAMVRATGAADGSAAGGAAGLAGTGGSWAASCAASG